MIALDQVAAKRRADDSLFYRIFQSIGATTASAPLRTEGLRIATPPIRLAVAAPDQVELRCLKVPDGKQVNALALAIGAKLHVTVRVRDLSDQYDSSPHIRPGNFELWLPKGQIPTI